MINFTFKGHKISIRNDDWKKLKERFNPENAEYIKDENRYAIKIRCDICYRSSCFSDCPLNKVRCGEDIIYSFLRRKILGLDILCISWKKEVNSQARRQLKVILRRMEKIEASQ